MMHRRVRSLVVLDFLSCHEPSPKLEALTPSRPSTESNPFPTSSHDSNQPTNSLFVPIPFPISNAGTRLLFTDPLPLPIGLWGP
ncbi:hypothetical protein B0H34DRAFT_726506 [Crassisporium funariophilum]|nr:hypothetical protein B0H34DRAFT_726506 [Crassisporium funariophilum]